MSDSKCPFRPACFAVLVGLALGLWAGNAQSEIRREGQWPKEEAAVTLTLQDVSRAHALQELADKAGWSLAVHAPIEGKIPLLYAKNLAADKVLEQVLAEGQYVVTREGTLLSIAAAGSAQATSGSKTPAPSSATPAPSATPTADPNPGADEAGASSQRGEDRVVAGRQVTVGQEETVHDLVVLGGSAEVLGTVTGDVGVVGGNATIRSGATVQGDATTVGGTLTIEDGARVDGNVGTVGGELRRAEGAHIGGRVSNLDGDDEDQQEDQPMTLSNLIEDAGAAMTRMALLFVFGAVLLGFATRRMESLQIEAAARPLRSFGLGIVGVLTSIVLFIALCITIIGIPIAILGLFLGFVAVYAGICAVLSAVGAALVRHRSANPYVHLAVGCGLYLLVGAMPYLGGIVTTAVVLSGIGVLVATRGAGMLPSRRNRGTGPYRTPAAA